MSTMAEEHERDYRHKNRCDDLRRSIERFEKEAERPLGAPLGVALSNARDLLAQDAAHIVRVWD